MREHALDHIERFWPSPSAGLRLQRKCDCGQHTDGGATCAECSQKQQSLQRRSGLAPETEALMTEATPQVRETLRSSGQPLDAATRAFMESQFVHDFSHVRIHTDQRAAESAQTLNALAYTVGRDVVFGAGQYQPETRAGRHLLAHELAHVVQQAASRPGISTSTLQRQSISSHIPPRPSVPPQVMPPRGTPQCAQACQRIYEKCASFRPNALNLDCWNALQTCLRERCGTQQLPDLPGLRDVPALQPKLIINQVGDRYEQEADRIADRVVRASPASPAPSPGSPKALSLKRSAPQKTLDAPPSVQRQSNREGLRARLQQVRTRLAELRAQQARLGDAFLEGQQRDALQLATQRLQTQSRAAAGARALWVSNRGTDAYRRAVTATRSGNTVTLSANFELTYLSLPDAAARQQAANDIPRIEAAIRDAWQVNIVNGDYAGLTFRLQPRVSYLPRGNARANNAFLIEVRAPSTPSPTDVFRDPSSADAGPGIISLNPGHLQGSRVIVIAHELLHLFGIQPDAYAPPLRRTVGGGEVGQWSVARPDAANRADLLGLIDPAVLQRLLREGSVRPEDVARQTGPVHIWEEEASLVLHALGVAPSVPPRPTTESDSFDPDEEREQVRRQGAARLAPSAARHRNALEALRWQQLLEEIMRLESEERTLTSRLATP